MLKPLSSGAVPEPADAAPRIQETVGFTSAAGKLLSGDTSEAGDKPVRAARYTVHRHRARAAKYSTVTVRIDFVHIPSLILLRGQTQESFFPAQLRWYTAGAIRCGRSGEAYNIISHNDQ